MERVAWEPSGSYKHNHVSNLTLSTKASHCGGFMMTHPLPKPPQNPHLHKRLLMKPLLIPNNLHRHHPPALMIHAPHHLPKTTLPQHIHHLIPIRQMVPQHDIVIPPLIIIPVIPRLRAPAILVISSARESRRR